MLLTQSSCSIGSLLGLEQEPKELAFPKEEKSITAEPQTWDNALQRPPIVVTKSTPDNLLYAGVPNDIKVYIEGESTEHLYVYSSSGELKVLDKSKGLYSFMEMTPGFMVEIIAKDTVSGVMAIGQFDVIDVPVPSAVVWKNRTAVNSIAAMSFTAKQFMEQNALVLYHDYNMKVPARCAATSYTMLRIDEKGQQTTYENQTKNGMFDEAAKKIINEAKKGDIYIFKDIKANCTQYPIKDVVYILK